MNFDEFDLIEDLWKSVKMFSFVSLLFLLIFTVWFLGEFAMEFLLNRSYASVTPRTM